MKRPVAIKLLPSPKGSGAYDPTTGRPAPDGHPGQAAPHGTKPTMKWFAVTRCPSRQRRAD